MSEHRLLNWHAEVSTILGQFPHLALFVNRMKQIIDQDLPVSDRVVSARELMERVLRSGPIVPDSKVNNPTIGAGNQNNPQTTIFNILPQAMNQTQRQVIEPIYPSWEAVETEIDSAEDLTPENKTIAKEIAKDIWDGVVNGMKDGAAIGGAIASLSQMTAHAPEILKLIGLA